MKRAMNADELSSGGEHRTAPNGNTKRRSISAPQGKVERLPIARFFAIEQLLSRSQIFREHVIEGWLSYQIVDSRP